MTENPKSRFLAELLFIPKTRLFRVASILWSGRTAATVIGLVNNIVLARALGVEGYGQFVLLLATALILNNLLDLRIWETAIKFLAQFRSYQQQEKTRAFVKLSYLLASVGAVLAVGVAAALALFVGVGYLPSAVTILVVPLSVSVALQTLNQVTLAFLRVYDHHVVQSAYYVFQASLTCALYIAAFCVFDLGIAGAALATLAATVLAVLMPTIFAITRLRVYCPSPASLRALADEAGQIIRFSVHVKLYGLLKLVREFDVIIVRFIANDFAVGIYSIAQRMLNVVNIIFEPQFNIVYPEMTRYIAEGLRSKLRKLVKYLTLINPAIVLLITAVFLVAGGPAIDLVLGSDYSAAFVPALLLLLSHVPQQAIVWSRPLYMALGRPNDFNMLTVLMLALRLAVLVPATFALLFNGPPIAYLAANAAIAVYMLIIKNRLLAPEHVNAR